MRHALVILFMLLCLPSADAQTLLGDRVRFNRGCVLESGPGDPEGVRVGRVCDQWINTSTGVIWGKWTGNNTNTGWRAGINTNARINGNLETTGYMQSPNYVSRSTGYRIGNLGDADFRYVNVDEFHASKFVADLQQSLNGIEIIAPSTAVLAANFTCPAGGATATLTVEDQDGRTSGTQAFATGDFVAMRTFSFVSGGASFGFCIGTVSNPSTPGGIQSWLFTRISGANGGALPAGTVIEAQEMAVNFGVSGNGWIEFNTIDGINRQNSPYMRIYRWSGGSPLPSNATAYVSIGQQRGITGINEWGAIFGAYGTSGSERYLRLTDQFMEARNMRFSMYSSNIERIRLDPDVPSIALGSAVPTGFSTGIGCWMGNDGGTYKWRCGNPAGDRAEWTGSNFRIVDNAGSSVINGTSILTASISASKALFGTGLNLIKNSVCEVSTEGWQGYTDSGLTATQNFAIAGYRLLDQTNTCYITVAGTPANGTLSASFGDLYAGEPGKRYEASAYLAVHRSGTSNVFLQFVNSSNTVLAQAAGTPCTAANAGGLTIDLFCRSVVFAVAPATTTGVRMFVLTTHNGSGLNPYLFWVRAYLGEALINQTEATVWGPGGFTSVTNGMILTNAIDARTILAGTITANKLNVTTLSAITANLGTVTAGTLTGVTATFGGGTVTLNSTGMSITAGTATANKIIWPSNGEIYGNGGGDLLLSAPDSVSLIAPGPSSLTVGSGYVLIDPGPGGYIGTHFIGGGTRFVCVGNDGRLFSQVAACV